MAAVKAFLIVAAALVLLLPASAGADNPVLTGDVGLGDAFVIGLTDASGARVTHLDPGTYTLVVHDHSALHNFDLFGTGVSVRTDVDGIGDSTFTVTFVDGTYNYVCDPHPTVMKGSFTVGTPPVTTTPAPAPAPSPAPAASKLSGRVGPGAKISLVATPGLAAGRAVITVKDASKTENFHLVGPGVNKATGVAFRGTVTWKVALKSGSYVFRSDRHPKLRGSFKVSA
jgi:hypothetical protein